MRPAATLHVLKPIMAASGKKAVLLPVASVGLFLDADNQAGAARHLVVQKPKPGRIGFVRTSLRHDI